MQNRIILAVTNNSTFIEGNITSDVYQGIKSILRYRPDDAIFRIKQLEATVEAAKKLNRFVMGVAGNDAQAYLNSNGEYDDEQNWVNATELQAILEKQHG